MENKGFFRLHLRFFALAIATGYLLGAGLGLSSKPDIWKFALGTIYLIGSALGGYLMVNEWTKIHPKVK